MERGTYTKNEILTQPGAWADALDAVEKCKYDLKKVFEGDYEQVIFTGCGSTYYLSLAAAAQFQEMTGRLARGVPGSELLFNPQTILGRGARTLLVAVQPLGLNL